MLPPGRSFHGVRRSAVAIMITAMTDCAPGERDGTHIARVPANSPFEFHVSPNISLGTIGTAVVLSAAAIPTTALVAICTAHGHWPIAFFGILTFAGLLFGFLGGRRSLRRSERIFLHEGQVVIERLTSSRQRSHTCLPQFGLRIERLLDPDYGHLALVLCHRDRRVEIARDLSPAEREQFESAFMAALDAAGPRIRATTRTRLGRIPEENCP